MPRTILISGAASGIGAAFLAHYARAEPDCVIYALDRTPFDPPLSLGGVSTSTSSSLQGVAFTSASTFDSNPLDTARPRIHTLTIDITDPAALATLSLRLAETAIPLDLVIHSAGVRGLSASVPLQNPSDVARAETLATTDAASMHAAFSVNALGTFLLLQALVPALLLAREPKVVVMGSRMGSLALNARGVAAGGGYAYRASKAGVNAVVRTLAVDVPRVVWVVLHPGRVETGLVGGVREERAIEVEEAVRGLVGLVEGLGMRDSGRFVDREGRDIPW